MCVIRFGGAEAEYLALTVHGRNIPDSTDFWDGNWLWCTAEARAGAFRGSVDGVLRNEDLARFLGRLEELIRRLTGVARFDTLDGWLDVQLTGDGRGHIEARCQLCDSPAGGNSLEFRLSLDQTYLPPLAAQVRTALAAFPVVGLSRA
jgi:hypothetical protein